MPISTPASRLSVRLRAPEMDLINRLPTSVEGCADLLGPVAVPFPSTETVSGALHVLAENHQFAASVRAEPVAALLDRLTARRENPVTAPRQGFRASSCPDRGRRPPALPLPMADFPLSRVEATHERRRLA